MNQMKDVAKMVGAEMNVEFNIEGDGDRSYRINTLGSSFKSCRGWMRDDEILRKLITGDLKIKWTPKIDEWYYYVDKTMVAGYDCLPFNDDYIDQRILARVKIYRTEEEVKQAVKKLGWVIE